MGAAQALWNTAARVLSPSNPHRERPAEPSALVNIPGRSPPLFAAPVSEAAHYSDPRRQLGRSLRISTVEGMLAEVVTVCAGGAVITGWALFLGCSPLVVGMITALPYLSQVAHPPAAWLGGRLGHRRLAIIASCLSRQVLLPLALLPFLPLSPEAKRALLVLTATTSALLNVVGNNAWVSWMGDLVPTAIRGRYFGRRTALCTLGNTAAAVLAGVLLDRAGPHGATGYVLGSLGALACLAGLATTWLMSLQHDPSAGRPPEPVQLAQALAPLRLPQTHRVLAYQICWNASVGLAASYFNFHMLKNLRMGFTLMAAYTTTVAVVRIAFLPLWGRALDRLGVRPVLIACSFGISLLPAVWLFPDPNFLWPIAIDAVLAGALWGGHNLASFALPLAFAPRAGRPYYLAAFAATGGMAFALATALGGAVLHALPAELAVLGRPLLSVQVLFLLSSVLRAAAALLSLRLEEDRAQPLRALTGLFMAHARGLRLRPLLARSRR